MAPVKPLTPTIQAYVPAHMTASIRLSTYSNTFYILLNNLLYAVHRNKAGYQVAATNNAF
jgi:hypothetical protein